MSNISKLPTSPILPNTVVGDGSSLTKATKTVLQQQATTINKLIDQGGGGAIWHSGSDVPAQSLGANADYYLRTTTSDVYAKTSGTWYVTANIGGADGADGTNGSNGTNGTNGANGTNGTGTDVRSGYCYLTTRDGPYSGVYYSGGQYISFSPAYPNTPVCGAFIGAGDGGNAGGTTAIVYNVSSSGFSVAVGGVEDDRTVPVYWIAIGSTEGSSGGGDAIYDSVTTDHATPIQSTPTDYNGFRVLNSNNNSVPVIGLYHRSGAGDDVTGVMSGGNGIDFLDHDGGGIATLTEAGVLAIKSGGGIQLNSSTSEHNASISASSNKLILMEAETPWRGAHLDLNECSGSGGSQIITSDNIADYVGTGTASNMYVDVKSFGATGDGTTDDTDAIQNAIDSMTAGVLFFPKGRYKVTSTLTVGADGHSHYITLLGEYAGSILLNYIPDDSNYANMLVVHNGNVTIKDMSFNETCDWSVNGGSTLGYTTSKTLAITFEFPAEGRIDSCGFAGFLIAIEFKSFNGWVSQCSAFGCEYFYRSRYRGVNCFIEGCHIFGGKFSVYLLAYDGPDWAGKGPEGVRVFNNTFLNFNHDARTIWIEQGLAIYLHNNVIDQVGDGGYGIYIAPTTGSSLYDIKITDNWIAMREGSGTCIYASGANGLWLTNNTFANTGSSQAFRAWYLNNLNGYWVNGNYHLPSAYWLTDVDTGGTNGNYWGNL